MLTYGGVDRIEVATLHDIFPPVQAPYDELRHSMA
jgi:hypothetical protein